MLFANCNCIHFSHFACNVTSSTICNFTRKREKKPHKNLCQFVCTSFPHIIRSDIIKLCENWWKRWFCDIFVENAAHAMHNFFMSRFISFLQWFGNKCILAQDYWAVYCTIFIVSQKLCTFSYAVWFTFQSKPTKFIERSIKCIQ